MPHTICVFNVNNLYVRYRFGSTFPGDVAGASAVNDPHCGYAPMYQRAAFQLFRPEQRALATQAITRGVDAYPDVICLMEVESLVALRRFAEDHLAGGRYSRAVLIDGRDLRRINVGVLSSTSSGSGRTSTTGIRTPLPAPAGSSRVTAWRSIWCPTRRAPAG